MSEELRWCLPVTDISCIDRRAGSQVLIKPGGELHEVDKHGYPTMSFSRSDDQRDRTPYFFSFGLEALGLVEWNQGVGISVVD